MRIESDEVIHKFDTTTGNIIGYFRSISEVSDDIYEYIRWNDSAIEEVAYIKWTGRKLKVLNKITLQWE